MIVAFDKHMYAFTKPEIGGDNHMTEIAIAGAMSLNHSFLRYLDRKGKNGMCFLLFSFDLDFTRNGSNLY